MFTRSPTQSLCFCAYAFSSTAPHIMNGPGHLTLYFMAVLSGTLSSWSELSEEFITSLPTQIQQIWLDLIETEWRAEVVSTKSAWFQVNFLSVQYMCWRQHGWMGLLVQCRAFPGGTDHLSETIPHWQGNVISITLQRLIVTLLNDGVSSIPWCDN